MQMLELLTIKHANHVFFTRYVRVLIHFQLSLM